MQVVFINECKSCEHKRRTGYDKYCKVQLLNGTISHDASNEQDAYLEPSQISRRDPFAKINNDYQPLNISAKKLCGYSICFMYKHKSQRAGQLPQEHVFLANLLSQNIYYTQWRSALWIPVKELILLTKFDSNSSCDQK